MAEPLKWAVVRVSLSQESPDDRNSRQTALTGYLGRRCQWAEPDLKRRTVAALMAHTLGGKLVTGTQLNTYFDDFVNG